MATISFFKTSVLFIFSLFCLKTAFAQTPSDKALSVWNEYVEYSNTCNRLKFDYTKAIVYQKSPETQLEIAKTVQQAHETAISELTKRAEDTAFSSVLQELIVVLKARQERFNYPIIEKELSGQLKLTQRQNLQIMIRMDNDLPAALEQIKVDKLRDVFFKKYGFKVIKDSTDHKTAETNAALRFERKATIISTHISVFMEDFVKELQNREYEKAQIALDSLKNMLPNITKNEVKNLPSIGDTKEVLKKLNRIVAIAQMFVDNKAMPMAAARPIFKPDNTAPEKVAEVYNNGIDAYNIYVKDLNEFAEIKRTYLKQFIEPLAK